MLLIVFTHITWDVKREKIKDGKINIFPQSQAHPPKNAPGLGGSLAFSLYITVDSEKRPDTLAHCQSLTCFVSTSAAISLDNILVSLSDHSLLQDIPWSAVTRQCMEYNANSSPWHSRSSRIWLTRDSPFQVRKKAYPVTLSDSASQKWFLETDAICQGCHLPWLGYEGQRGWAAAPPASIFHLDYLQALQWSRIGDNNSNDKTNSHALSLCLVPHSAECFPCSVLLISRNAISKWALCARPLYRWGNWGPASVSERGFLTSRQYCLPQALSVAGALGCVGTSVVTMACWGVRWRTCLECVLCTCHIMGPLVPHRSQSARSLSPTGGCTWASLLPRGPGRLKTLESSSYLICVLL